MNLNSSELSESAVKEEIGGLCSTLKIKKESNNKYVCDDLIIQGIPERDLGAVRGKKYDQIAIVGHSRYYSPIGNPISIKDRFLGDFPLTRDGGIIGCLVDIAVLTKAKSIKFYACETACFKRTINNVEKKSSALPKDSDTYFFTNERFEKIRSQDIASGNFIESSSRLSTVEYFSYKFLERLNSSSSRDCREVVVSGLNGVGYIVEATSKNPRPAVRAFDSSSYDAFVRIMKKSTQPKGKKKAPSKEEMFLEFERNYVDSYPAPYKLKYRVSIS